MKLILAVVNRRDMRALHDALVGSGQRFAEVGSTGGFLQAGTVTLLMGVDDEQVDSVLALIRSSCCSREEAVRIPSPGTNLHADGLDGAVTVTVGGAQVFVLNIERAENV